MDVLAKFFDYKIKVVAFVDCDDDGPEMMLPYWEAEMGGFETVDVPRLLRSIPEIISFVQDHAQAVICSNRLDRADSGLFSGAELAAALYDAGIPTLLVTRYLDIDQHTSIRRWRAKLPVVLHLRDFESYAIKDALGFCSAELQGCIAESRRPYQVMLHITDVERRVEGSSIDVCVACWDHYQSIRLPFSLIPEHLHDHLIHNSWLFAHVNIRAKWPEELYFRDFAVAPEPEYDEDMVYCVDILSGVSMNENRVLWFENQKDQERSFEISPSEIDRDMQN